MDPRLAFLGGHIASATLAARSLGLWSSGFANGFASGFANSFAIGFAKGFVVWNLDLFLIDLLHSLLSVRPHAFHRSLESETIVEFQMDLNPFDLQWIPFSLLFEVRVSVGALGVWMTLFSFFQARHKA